jgi:hypothetical protein
MPRSVIHSSAIFTFFSFNDLLYSVVYTVPVHADVSLCCTQTGAPQGLKEPDHFKWNKLIYFKISMVHLGSDRGLAENWKNLLSFWINIEEEKNRFVKNINF